VHFHGQYERNAVPHIFWCEFDAARNKIAEVAELTNGFRNTGAQAIDVCAAIVGRD